MKQVPFSPPRIDEVTIEAVTKVLRSGWITTGPQTRLFEQHIAEYTGSPKVLCLNSWTNAAELVLRWFGIGPGDEVIVPVYTYAASANIIIHTGATPVFVDCAPYSFLCDPEAIRAAITSRTKVIMPVDIGGLPADYDRINAIAKEAAQLFSPTNEAQRLLGRPLVMGDAAHSFGARFQDKKLGNQADVVAFSFHAVKNLTTAEGGALALNLPAPFDNSVIWRQLNISGLHGQTKDALSKSQAGQWEYDVVEAGYKCNMTDIQAAIGLVELNRYESETLPRRKMICERYLDGFHNQSWAILPEFKNESSESSYHLFMLRIKGFGENGRNELIRLAAEEGISLNVHFQPLPRLSFYKNQCGLKESDFPNAMNQFANEVSLPVYFDLSNEDVDRVIKTIIHNVEHILS